MIDGIIPLTLLFTLAGVVATLFSKSATANRVALIASIPAVLVTSWMFYSVGFSTGGYQFTTNWEWIPALGINLEFGVDGLSASLAWLTAILTPLVIIYSWKESKRPQLFFALLLMLNAAVIGVFTTLDLFLFYIFWEFVLIPMYFILNIWGGENRRYAATKFLVYTGGASLVMLLGIMAVYFAVGLGTFSIPTIVAAGSGLGFAKNFGLIVFGVLAFGFLVKLPSVPFHTWLPDAHVQAPTAGSVMLAGVLLKMGSYGLMRIAFPIFPEAALAYKWVFFTLGTVSVLYGAFLCLAQDDLKSLIAYSSISHMGMITIALATFSDLGWAGAAYMNVAHGIIAAGLFMAAGSLHHATGTRSIRKLGGLAKLAPHLSALTVVLFLASLGLPGMMGFIAEFTIFAAIYESFGNWIWLPIWSVLITAGYYLWALQRAYFGPVPGAPELDDVHDATPEMAHGHGGSSSMAHVHDITPEEKWPTFVLVLLAIIFGVFPSLLLGQMNQWTTGILSLMGVN